MEKAAHHPQSKKLSVGPVFQMFIGKDTSMVKDFISFLTLTELGNNASARWAWSDKLQQKI